MYIHEHQAKDILRRYGVGVVPGALATSPEEAESAARSLGGGCVVKAQILAGGRGLAGGIRPVAGPGEARAAAQELLGSRLVTEQTGPEGRLVRSVYLESRVESDRELYLAALVDRSVGRVALLAAREGGEEIESQVARDPASLLRLVIDPVRGLDLEQARTFAGELGLEGASAEAGAKLMRAVYGAFLELDANLIEINPLAITAQGELVAVDVKMGFDDNALFRHPDIAALRDPAEDDPTETEAARYEINYVKLEGNIGVMVNGAGLALATLDLLINENGVPADFMDVRPVASREQIATGFELVLRNPKVRAILVNIFGGGILRCDTVAEGIAAAVRAHGLEVPLIVRVAGTNMEIARKVLTSQGIPAVFVDDMAEAAQAAVRAAKREAA